LNRILSDETASTRNNVQYNTALLEVKNIGLPPDAWKWPETAVYRFEAEVFGEKDAPKKQ